MLLQQIKRLEADADMLWSDGDETKARMADAALHDLEMQNEARVSAACARLEAFDADARDDGWLNASQTAPWSEMSAGGKHAELMRYCEFWELAVRSAQDIADLS